MNSQLLIVDDEREIRKSLGLYFESQGYTVDMAENGETALDILAVKKIDVIISDIVMPKMSGVDLLGEVRKQYPMTRVIIITGYVTFENALACMRRGADTVVFKPLEDLSELTTAVETSLASLRLWQKKLKELVGMKNKETEASHV